MDHFDRIRRSLDTVEDAFADARGLPDTAPGDQRNATFDELATAARALHDALSAAGVDVQHDSQVRSRGVRLEDPAFYRHLPAVEALIHIARRVLAGAPGGVHAP